MSLSKYIIIICVSFFFSCSESKKMENFTIQSEKKNSGLNIFNNRCSSCHGIDGTLGFSGAKNLKKSKKNLDEIKLQIINGKGAMNPFKNILTSSEIDSVSQYVLTFQK